MAIGLGARAHLPARLVVYRNGGGRVRVERTHDEGGKRQKDRGTEGHKVRKLDSADGKAANVMMEGESK